MKHEGYLPLIFSSPFLIKLTCVIAFISVLFVSCRRETSRAEFVMGTVCSVTLFEQANSRVYQEIFGRIREIENLTSVNIPSSDISRVNAAAGIEKVQVHEDVFKIIQRALYFAELSGGAFDPTVGPLVSLWGIGTDNPRVPEHEEIENILPLTDWRNVELDAQRMTVFLKHRRMALDLGAIAKGYAADEAAAIVNNAGIKRAIIDLGGNIVICGGKEDKSPWRVGVQNPGERRGEYLGIIQITGTENGGSATVRSIVTSGVYERFFEKDGARYHHIFLPSSGYPAGNDLLSVTITARNSTDADALSTAVFVLGYEKGKALVESLPETEAVFIFKTGSVRKTGGSVFTLTDSAFRFED